MVEDKFADFTDAQKEYIDAINEVIDENNKESSFICLRGLAGTGKTFVSSYAVKMAADRELKVLVMTPTLAAMRASISNLEQHIKTDRDKKSLRRITHKTVASCFQKPVKKVFINGMEFSLEEEDIGQLYAFLRNFLNEEQIEYIIQESKIVKYVFGESKLVSTYDVDTTLLRNLLSNTFGKLDESAVKQQVVFEYMDPKDVVPLINQHDAIFIDEMPMVNEDVIQILEKAVELSLLERSKGQFRFKLVSIVGDIEQLSPVEGEMNHYTQLDKDDENVYSLDEILRSTNVIATLGKDIVNGRQLRSMTSTYPEIIHRADSMPIEELVKANKEVFESADIVLTLKNKTVDELNRLIRTTQNGLSEVYVKNDVLVVTANTSDKVFINSAEVIVKEAYSEKDALELIKYLKEGSEISNEDIKKRVSYFTPLSSSNESEEVKKVTKDALDIFSAAVQKGTITLLKVDQYGKEYLVFTKQLNEKYNTGVQTALENAASSVESMFPCVHFISVSLGFARTIHKAQGSEWKNVVVILSKSDLFIGNSKRLQVTAVTRAKENLNVFLI